MRLIWLLALLAVLGGITALVVIVTKREYPPTPVRLDREIQGWPSYVRDSSKTADVERIERLADELGMKKE